MQTKLKHQSPSEKMKIQGKSIRRAGKSAREIDATLRKSLSWTAPLFNKKGHQKG